MSFVVPELGTEFSEDLEKMVLDYMFEKYDIADPSKGSNPIDNSDPDFVRFRIGLPDFHTAYEISFIQTVTNAEQKGIGKERFLFYTTIEALIRMKRLKRSGSDGIDPQLGNMEREIQRIARHYRPNDIVGIKDMYSAGFDAQERIYNATDSWSKSDWRSIVRINLLYEKVNLF